MDRIKRNQAGGIWMQENKDDEFTVAGTNIEAVKEANKNSGMSYNEVKEFLAKSTEEYGTPISGDTDIQNGSSQDHPSQKKSK